MTRVSLLARYLIAGVIVVLTLASTPLPAAAQSTNRYVAADDAYARKDYGTAHRLWLDIAEEGNASAYFNLGRMYVFGEGVPIDLIEAYKWFTLADHTGMPEAKSGLARVGRLMTPSDLTEGQYRIERWYDQHPGLRPARPNP